MPEIEAAPGAGAAANGAAVGELRSVGQPLPRLDGMEKVTGAGRYAADLIPPGTLWSKVLYSSLPHARIKRIDTTRARQLPGVRAVLTGQDIPPGLHGHQVKDTPILARDVVRYVGDRVAAVAADDADIAEEAVGLIEVEYDDLPAVFDQLSAQESAAPWLHPDLASYARPAMNTDPSLKNVQTFTRYGHGDVEQGFAESDLVLEHEFRTQTVHQAYIEPHCYLIEIADDGQIHVWAADQGPYRLRTHLAEVADCDVENVIVHPVWIGASFGAKDDVRDVPLVYWLAKLTGRRVVLRWTYTEELLYGTPRHSSIIRLKTGLKRDGRLWAHDGIVIFNGGAYASYKPNLQGNMTGGLQLGGSYRIPHTRLESRCVYTNQVPGGYMRSPGEAQAHFAVETHIDMLADALGMDPVQFRRLNCLQEGDITPNGYRLRDVRCQEVLDRAAALSHWDTPLAPAPDGKLRGRGLSLGDRHTGTAVASTRLAADRDGTVTIYCALTDVGVGAHTAMQQILAELLGISAEQVRVERVGTNQLPFDQGVKGMSATYSTGSAVQGAALGLIASLKERAAAEWGVPVTTVEWRDGQAWCADMRHGPLSLATLVRFEPEPLTVSYTFMPPGMPDVLTFQSQVAEVAVDPETGEVTLERLYSVHDVGQIVNPITHGGQIEGGLIQGLGYALMEDLAIEEGRVLTASLGEFRIPTARDVPPLALEYVRAAVGPAPFQAKGIAESGLSTMAPAVVNAISRATGVRFTAIPVTAEKVHAALRARAAAQPAPAPAD